MSPQPSPVSGHAAALTRLSAVPSVALALYPTPLEDLPRLRAALGQGPRLVVKRDDAISFAFGGNKVRKIELVAARALAEGADTLLTVGGVRSNHARVTAAAAARLGLACRLIINGSPPVRLAGNALIDSLVGAEIEYVASRADRVPAMRRAAQELRRAGRRPFEVPLGASTPLGALGYVRAVGEVIDQGLRPDVIVVSASSGGTLAGIRVGAELFGLECQAIGVSPDDPAEAIEREVRTIIEGMGPLLGLDGAALARGSGFEIDDRWVGEGYGIPTPESREATQLAARTEGLLLDPAYTAKTMAALVGYLRRRRFHESQTVLFWHTGGQIELAAGQGH